MRINLFNRFYDVLLHKTSVDKYKIVRKTVVLFKIEHGKSMMIIVPRRYASPTALFFQSHRFGISINMQIISSPVKQDSRLYAQKNEDDDSRYFQPTCTGSSQVLWIYTSVSHRRSLNMAVISHRRIGRRSNRIFRQWPTCKSDRVDRLRTFVYFLSQRNPMTPAKIQLLLLFEKKKKPLCNASRKGKTGCPRIQGIVRNRTMFFVWRDEFWIDSFFIRINRSHLCYLLYL